MESEPIGTGKSVDAKKYLFAYTVTKVCRVVAHDKEHALEKIKQFESDAKDITLVEELNFHYNEKGCTTIENWPVDLYSHDYGISLKKQ